MACSAFAHSIKGQAVVDQHACPLLFQGGDGVYPVEIRLEDFGAWLSSKEFEPVGKPGTCFQSPLALWLSERMGGVYGADGLVYGRALWDGCCWLPLPRWARMFAARLETLSASVVLGDEAFTLLAQVELVGGMR